METHMHGRLAFIQWACTRQDYRGLKKRSYHFRSLRRAIIENMSTAAGGITYGVLNATGFGIIRPQMRSEHYLLLTPW